MKGKVIFWVVFSIFCFGLIFYFQGTAFCWLPPDNEIETNEVETNDLMVKNKAKFLGFSYFKHAPRFYNGLTVSSGNVGIGTTRPTSLLHLSGISPKLTIDTHDGYEITFTGRGTANINSTVPDEDIKILPAGGGIGGNLGLGSGGVNDRVFIKNNGNVGIGTTEPSVSLHNNGDFITKGPWVDVRAFGAMGDDDIDDTVEIQDAINSLPSDGGTIFFPRGSYLFTGLTIPANISNLNLIGARVILIYTPSTGNGITFAGEADNFVMKNIVLYSRNSSSGAGIYSDQLSTRPLRDFVIEDVNIAEFKSGIIIQGLLNGLIQRGRFSGQGLLVSGGVGIQVGEDYNHAGNMIRIKDVYVSVYEKGIWVKYASPSCVTNSIFEGNRIGLDNDQLCYLINPFFLSPDGIASIDNSSYLHHDYLRQPDKPVITSTHRYFTIPDAPSRIDVYRTLPQTIERWTDQLVRFDGESEDWEDQYDNTVDYKFTTPFNAPGYYLVTLSLMWDAREPSRRYIAMIYKNGEPIANAIQYSPITAQPGDFIHLTVSVTKLIWLNGGDFIQGFARNEQNDADAEIYHGSANTYMTILKL